MKSYNLALIAGLSAVATPAVADPVPMDTPLPIDGGEMVCTGIGSGKDDPRWADYPVRIEFSNHDFCDIRHRPAEACRGAIPESRRQRVSRAQSNRISSIRCGSMKLEKRSHVGFTRQ